MKLFSIWCECQREEAPRKRYWQFRERSAGRAAIAGVLPDIIRSHYDDINRIAEAVKDLGYATAAGLLAERLPRTPRARSGELGEILATELIEEELGFEVPVRRLRYKDGREMALRGDDFIGVRIDQSNKLCLLKGEAKSRAQLEKTTIDEARAALSRDNGRPTPISLLFVADRLMDCTDAKADLGRMIRNEVAYKTLPASQIDHAIFTFSGNEAPAALKNDLLAAGTDRTQTVIHLRVVDHQAFIKISYESAGELGNN